MRSSRVKIVLANSTSSQYEFLRTAAEQDSRFRRILDYVESCLKALSNDPYARIGRHHHQLTHSGLRKGSYACGFPLQGSDADLSSFRFSYYVFPVKSGTFLGAVPYFVQDHLSASDIIDYDYVVFVQDLFYDYHDVSKDSERLHNRDSVL